MVITQVASYPLAIALSREISLGLRFYSRNQQLPAQLEKTIRANLAYFEQVMADYIDSNQDASADSIAKERRQAALENVNAAAQRLRERTSSYPRRR